MVIATSFCIDMVFLIPACSGLYFLTVSKINAIKRVKNIIYTAFIALVCFYAANFLCQIIYLSSSGPTAIILAILLLIALSGA
jgi:hypothetical protein